MATTTVAQPAKELARQRKKEDRRMKRREVIKQIKHYRTLYPILIFGVAFFIVFSYAPLYGIQLAFKDYKVGLGIGGSPWIGLGHFHTLLNRAEFWSAFRNTIVISFLKLPFSFVCPIILALCLNELRSRKLTRTLQIIYTLPHFLSWIIIGGIMENLLMSSGTINQIISAMGGTPIDFLQNGALFRTILVFTDVWKGAGWNCIIYMATIASIDPALYESATIDGANRWQKALYITLPSIRGTAATLFIMALGGVMNANFDQVFNLYNPTVYSQGDIIDTYLYRITFMQAPDYGFSTALGLFKGIINCILLLTANFIVGKMDENSKLV